MAMVDLPKNISTNEVVASLKDVYDEAFWEDDHFVITKEINGLSITIYCSLPPNFPYEFPIIKLSDKTKLIATNMPHMYTNSTLCLYDNSITSPNFHQPKKIILDTVSRAFNLIENTLYGRNQDDFLDEFKEYWNTKAPFVASSFINNVQRYKKFYYTSVKSQAELFLITDTEKELYQKYFSLTHQILDSTKISRGLLIPVKNFDATVKLPKNDTDIIDFVYHHSYSSQGYNQFLQDNINKQLSLIIFSFSHNMEAQLFGWLHFPVNIPSGFRQGHVNLKYAFSKSHTNGVAIKVEDCTNTRLYRRGGDGIPAIVSSSCIVGCGSIGSLLANSLLMSGTKKFVLNDIDIIKHENIARHFCGHDYINFNKAEALGFKLEQHNPNVSCDNYTINAHDFFKNNTDKINSCDMLFVATGNIGIENHICKLVNEGQITIPVIILWVEPYCLGGHAIVIKGPQDLYKEIFDSQNFNFYNPIVVNANELNKREAGCQSTYMPYSGFYVQTFINQILEQILNVTINKTGNFLLNWYGPINEECKYPAKLSLNAKKHKKFDIEEIRID